MFHSSTTGILLWLLLFSCLIRYSVYVRAHQAHKLAPSSITLTNQSRNQNFFLQPSTLIKVQFCILRKLRYFCHISRVWRQYVYRSNSQLKMLGRLVIVRQCEVPAEEKILLSKIGMQLPNWSIDLTKPLALVILSEQKFSHFARHYFKLTHAKQSFHCLELGIEIFLLVANDKTNRRPEKYFKCIWLLWTPL